MAKKTEKTPSKASAKPEDRLVHEKRVHPRRTLRSQVIFEDESGEGFIYFYSTDISIGGLFLESDIPLKLGTRVFLSFALRDDAAPLRAIGRVVRVERETADSLTVVGMGVQFSDLTESAKKIIEDYVSPASA
jgi:type IV pilus assembly protein PilZ